MPGNNTVKDYQEKKYVHKQYESSLKLKKAKKELNAHQKNFKLRNVIETIKEIRGERDKTYERLDQIRLAKEESKRVAVLHYSRGTKLVNEGKNVLEFDISGSGFQHMRAEHKGLKGKGVRRQETEVEEVFGEGYQQVDEIGTRLEHVRKVDKEKVIVGEDGSQTILKKQRITMAGPLKLGGASNRGDYSIDNLRKYMLYMGKKYITQILDDAIEKGQHPREIHVIFKGHSRGAVAAKQGAEMLNYWLYNEPKYRDFADVVKFEVTQYDPVPGFGSDSGLNRVSDYLSKDLEQTQDMDKMRPLGEKAESTVFYSLHDNHLAGGMLFKPEEVRGAKRVIINPLNHSTGLDQMDDSQEDGRHRLAYTDAKTGEVYRSSGISELPPGVYIMDQMHNLVRMNNINEVDRAMKAMIKDVSWQQTDRFERIKGAAQSWFDNQKVWEKQEKKSKKTKTKAIKTEAETEKSAEAKTERKLELWEQKLIGRTDRYLNTITGKIASYAWYMGEEVFDYAMNYLFDYMTGKINPKVKSNQLYGKKMERPWGIKKQLVRSGLGSVLENQSVRDSISSVIKRTLKDPKQVQYVSGDVVAATCFSVALMGREAYPPIHFDDKDMVAFYNTLGFAPDEGEMIADMYQETIKVKDSNFTDAQWRTYIMPIILSESYKKQLNQVYETLQEEYMNTPAMSKIQFQKRMNQAQELLGKIYQGFSRSLANNTEYLEAPMKIFETDESYQPPEKSLTEEERQKYENHQTKALVSKEDVVSFQKYALRKKRPETAQDFLQAFYRSLSGAVGKRAEHKNLHRVKPISEDRSAFNLRCFINAVAALKKYKESIGEKAKRESLDILNIMQEDLAAGFGLDREAVEDIMDKDITLEDIYSEYRIEEEVLFVLEKKEVNQQESSTIDFMTEFANAGGKLVSDVVNLIRNGVDIGEIKVNLTESDIQDDLFGDSDRRMYDFKAEQERKAAILETDKKEDEHILKEVKEESIQQLDKVQDEPQPEGKNEQQKKEEEIRNQVLGDLEPWQKKLIGHEKRYSNTWIGQILQGIYEKYGGTLDTGVDQTLAFVAGSMNPDVQRYEVYGKKLDRPWGVLSGLPMVGLSKVIQMESVSRALKQEIQKEMRVPGLARRVSGEHVAMACFSPTFIQVEKRPPCHFDRALMAKFYNETGILPDEAAIVGDMLSETMKIEGKIYTDEQWRKKLMPQILKGSYQKQLRTVFQMLKREYQNNYAISKEQFRVQMEKAARALGEMYRDFSHTLANTTEFLEVPLNFLETEEKHKIPENTYSVLTKEQIELAQGIKTDSLTTQKEIDSLISQETKAERVETVGGLLEQFYKATSGYVGDKAVDMAYKAKAFDAQKRDLNNERCMIAAIAAAKKMSSMLRHEEEKQLGFFSRLFGRKEPVEERLALSAMKESLKVYGFTEEQLEDMLNPEKSLEEVKQGLGITEEVILGIQKIEIPPSEHVWKKQRNFIDHVLNYTPEALKIAIGTTSLLWKGTKWVAAKTAKWAYNKLVSQIPTGEIELKEAQAEIVKDTEEEGIEQIQEEQLLQEGEEQREDIRKEEIEDIQEEMEEEIDDQVIDEFNISPPGQQQEAQGWGSWAAGLFSGAVNYMFGSGQATNVDEKMVHDEIIKQRDQIIKTMDELVDQGHSYEQLAHLVCLNKISKAISAGKIQPEQVMKGLESGKMDQYIQKYKDNPKFRLICDRMVQARVRKKQESMEPTAMQGGQFPGGQGKVQTQDEKLLNPILAEQVKINKQEQQVAEPNYLQPE